MNTLTRDRLVNVAAYCPSDLEVLVEEVLRRATARAALASAYARGRNNWRFADQLAVEEMRTVLNATLPVGAEVVIGEGELDEAPMLYIGERLGPNQDQPPQLLIAVDPLEGTKLCARWMPGAICVIAAALVREGTIWPGVDGYMEKLVFGHTIAKPFLALKKRAHSVPLRSEYQPGQPLLDQPIEVVAALASEFTGKPMTKLVAEILERPRNAHLVKRLRRLHVQVRLITDGDITSAWRALDDDQEVDFTVGIGAAPEGVIGAAMANVLGGYMEGRCWFDGTDAGEQQRRRFLERGVDITRVNTVDELAGGNVMIAFTAVTDSVVPGVTYEAGGVAHTHTIVGRSRTGTHYYIQGTHKAPPPPPADWPVNEE